MIRKKRIRVLVCDDSPLFAEAIVDALQGDPEIDVIGIAEDGRLAVSLTERLKPDLITMDILMPVMDGLEAIERIMASNPTPILVMTADPRGPTGELSFEALRRGALDLVEKPERWPSSRADRMRLRSRLKLLAGVAV